MLGETVDEAELDWYEAAVETRRELGVETDDYDGVLYLVCPDCHGGWPRIRGTGRLAELAAEAVALHERARASLVDLEAVRTVLATHGKAVAFALGINGFKWTGWAVDPRDGATLYLLMDEVPMTEARKEQAVQVQELVTDILGYAIVRLVGEMGYTVSTLGLFVEQVPPFDA